jgi:DNA mismatch repair protein MutL
VSIKLLSEDVWSRIAAGEVVERPSSAVKEMIENSLDAGARRIRVKLWDGGRVRIVVEDDGAGIAFNDLSLALTRHATSKIGGIEDLESIHTLGYRGEALASLVAVAKVEIRSRAADGEGGLIRAYEGSISSHVETNCSPGTRVQVDELFANLPARRKFLKSAAGELRRIATLLREYAICRPEVGFVLEHDGRSVFSTDGGGDRRRALEQLWGAEPEILTVGASVGRIALECWWQPRQGRNDVAAFVNGRSVNDPLIRGAVSAAARELVGAWALFFSLDPALVDVNIHPAKTEIRFRYPGEIFDVVKEAAAQLGGRAPVFVRDGRTFSTESSPGHQGIRPEEGQQEQRRPPDARSWEFRDASPMSQRTSAPFQAPRPDTLFGRLEAPDFGPSGTPFFSNTESDIPDLPFMAGETPRVENSEDHGDVGSFGEATYLGQLDSGYLVFDTPAGAAIVDPHAAHERVAFERIRATAKDGQRAQPLLIPVLLPPTLQLEAEEKKDLLEGVGFALEVIEGGLRLTAVPAVANVTTPPETLLRSSLAALRDEGDADATELLWRTWATMACKEAVKATSKLRPEEAMTLWRDLHECRQPFFCPHGRPTILELSNAELLRHFGRE